GPSARSDRGSKRRREGGEHASASTPSKPATRSTGRSTTGTQSRQLSASESAFAEEPVQTTCQMEEPSHLVFETGAEDQPIVQISQHPECFSQPRRPPTSDRDWNKTLPATQGNAQSWISKLFYGFVVNRESALDVYSKRRIIAVTELKIVEWHNYKHLDWISVHRDNDKIYKFKEGDFKRLRLQDIKDMLLLLVQGKLSNLTVEERFAFNVSLTMFTRSIVIQRCVEDLQLGVESYQKRLNLTNPDTYQSDLKRREAYTAYDGTLNDVRNALDDRLKGIRMHQVKDNKIDLLVQQYEKFTILEKESIDSGFTIFNTIIASLGTLDEGVSSKNYVRKFLRVLHPKLRAIEKSKDLSSLTLDELISNLKVHKVVMEKDSKIYRGKKERVKSIALKAKKESSDDETSTSRSDDEEYVMAIRNFKKFFERKGKFVRCDDPNHLIGDCPKPSRNKDQKAFIGGSWSDSKNDAEDKTNDEICLMAQSSNENSEIIDAQGITHNFLAPRTPQSNGVVERKNRTLQEMSKTMLNE
nr:zf-CCHC domain-containing protein/DUF4219 domain-containing protein/UBN2 domain-containing protein [Tanacetum cinerariifolium]